MDHTHLLSIPLFPHVLLRQTIFTISHLFILSRQDGLVKLALTGPDAGRILLQRFELAVHAGGSIAYLDSRTLLLRTPILPPTELLVIDSSTFDIIGSRRVRLGGEGGGEDMEDCGWELQYEKEDKSWGSVGSIETRDSQ
eukprot:595403-Amorphochlora_amoeboformis.AAC.1